MINLICDGQMTLGEFLAARTRLGHFKIKKTIAGGEVKVNGGRVRSDVLLAAGDAVTVYAKEPPPPYEIVYRDDNVLFVSKPRGMEVEGERSLESQLMKDGKKARAVNRLDRNTSGLMLFAKSRAAEEAAKRAFARHKIEKHYYALVAGDIASGGTAVTYMGKDAAAAYVRVSDTPKDGYVRAVTEYEPVERTADGGRTLVRVKLVTGRTHQIRAFFAHIGHPLIGDGKYGDGRGGQRLVAYRLGIGSSAGLKSADGRTFELPYAECRRRLGLE